MKTAFSQRGMDPPKPRSGPARAPRAPRRARPRACGARAPSPRSARRIRPFRADESPRRRAVGRVGQKERDGDALQWISFDNVLLFLITFYLGYCFRTWKISFMDYHRVWIISLYMLVKLFDRQAQLSNRISYSIL